MFIFLLIVLIIIVCMLAIYFHIKTLAWKINRLENQLEALQKTITEKTVN